MRLGDTGGNYPLNSTPEQRELADLIVQLCGCMKQQTQAARAGQLWVSPALLSRFANAHRVPDVETLRKLHSLAREGGHTQAPCTLPELLKLRELVKYQLSMAKFQRPCQTA